MTIINIFQFFCFLKKLFLFFIFYFFFPNSGITIEKKGEILFSENCIACHRGGQNIIIPEKSLKKDVLENNGMNNKESIIYQIINGKNGMPAFGGRLKEYEIEIIANYILNELKN